MALFFCFVFLGQQKCSSVWYSNCVFKSKNKKIKLWSNFGEALIFVWLCLGAQRDIFWHSAAVLRGEAPPKSQVMISRYIPANESFIFVTLGAAGVKTRSQGSTSLTVQNATRPALISMATQVARSGLTCRRNHIYMQIKKKYHPTSFWLMHHSG